jgi:SAM-dependent methyltransferase
MDGWTSGLRDGQYRTDANLSARQAIYAYRVPRVDLAATVLELAAPRRDETVLDVGCGNGTYLAALDRPAIGVDLSTGMLRTARSRAPAARLVGGDAGALPFRDGIADVTLAAHMLYHVPEPVTAVRELRRVTRHGGRVLVVLNGADQLREFGRPDRLDLDAGQALLAAEFTSVRRVEFRGTLEIPEPGPVEAYLRSMPGPPDPLPRFRYPLTLTTHTGCLIAT